MVVQVDAQPGGEDFRRGFGCAEEVCQRDPFGGHDLGRVGGDRQGQGGLGGEDLHDFMFDEALADLGAVFDFACGGEGEGGDAEFFGQAAVGAGECGLGPMRVGAAGVRPKAGGVVFGEGALLDEDVVACDHEDRDGHVAQAALVDLKFADGGKGVVDPSGDGAVHGGPNLFMA